MSDRTGFKTFPSEADLHPYAATDTRPKQALINDLKTYLDSIRKQLSEIENDIHHGLDKVRHHCDTLRVEINHTTLLTVQKVESLGQGLIKQVDKYESTCVSMFRRNEAEHTAGYRQLVGEMREFSLEWETYLTRNNVDSNQIDSARSLAAELEKRSIAEKKRLNAILFNKKLIKFEKNNDSMSELLGKLVFQSMAKSFKNIRIRHILADYSRISPSSLDYAQIDSDTDYILYQTNTDTLKALTISSSGQVLAVHSSPCTVIQFKKYKDVIFTNYRDSRGYFYLQCLSLRLKEMHSISLHHALGSSYDNACSAVSVNDKFVYCLQAFCNQVRIFTRRLQYLKSVGQASNCNKAFYFPKNIVQLECRSERFFWLNPTSLRILREQTGLLVVSLPVSADKFVFDSRDNVYLVDKSVAKLTCFDLNGLPIRHIELFDYSVGCCVFLDESDSVVIVD
jgi:hypothetical protein